MPVYKHRVFSSLSSAALANPSTTLKKATKLLNRRRLSVIWYVPNFRENEACRPIVPDIGKASLSHEQNSGKKLPYLRTCTGCPGITSVGMVQMMHNVVNGMCGGEFSYCGDKLIGEKEFENINLLPAYKSTRQARSRYSDRFKIREALRICIRSVECRLKIYSGSSLTS